MVNPCIICGSPANSKEHILPAAFGGRRPNRGIYCHAHNQAFSRHVVSLLGALDIVNAELGVVPDGEDAVRPFRVTSDKGDNYLLASGELRFEPPSSLDSLALQNGKRLELSFDNRSQADRWSNDMRAKGHRFKMAPLSPPRSTLHVRPFQVTKTLGDEPFMRGVMYLGITFLARYLPDLARSEGLSHARQVIAKDLPPGDMVLWEPPSTLQQFESSPFRYGHTVAVGPIEGGSKIGAFISFFGFLNFGVTFGERIDHTLPPAVLIHVDPLAKHAPKDLKESWHPGLHLSLGTPDTCRNYIRQVAAGAIPDPLLDVLNSARQDKLERTCQQFLTELGGIEGARGRHQMDLVMAQLSKNDQIVFNLLRRAVELVSGPDSELPPPILKGLDAFTAVESKAPRGIASSAEAGLTVAKVTIAKHIVLHADAGTLTVQALANLLGGSEGAAAVLRALTDILFEQLRRMNGEARGRP